MSKQISDNCLTLVKRWEGCDLTAYRDPVGVWTIGYGTTDADRSITGVTIKKGLKISQETAESWLRKSLETKYLPLVLKYDDRYHWNQNQLDALVSFAYNIGSIDQLTANGTRSIAQISAHITAYNKAGGRVLNGLTNRRREEKALFDRKVSTVSTKKYTVTFQTESKYKVVRYGGNSVYNSACGPASLCNALRAAGIADVGLLTMCKLAVSCGARVDGGTDMQTLLKAASEKYGFSFTGTYKNAYLRKHLKAGGTAILHAGSAYQLFANGGHFVAAVGASGDVITVLDSYWYDGKYTSTTLRRDNVKVIAKGVIQTSLIQCGKATIDRNPSYYLIMPKPKTATTTAKVNARSGAGVTKRKLGTIDKGATLTVLEETRNWIKTGVWIAKKHCELEDGRAVTLANLNARAANSIKSDKVGTIRKGVTLSVLEMTENWVKVSFWVARKYTK
ncbi:MAG: SH3 domain-containing protein [Clostridiales bacterium]|nr:SH3 domain-containing protein [Clostridiales bacterium]